MLRFIATKLRDRVTRSYGLEKPRLGCIMLIIMLACRERSTWKKYNAKGFRERDLIQGSDRAWSD